MSAEYPIVDVDPKWKAEPEQMGSKDKFWFHNPASDVRDWLFKFPTENTGGHWAEKIAYEIARKIGILAPRVELARYCTAEGEPRRGSVARSFTSEYELYHGNQILAGMDDRYNPEQKFNQRMHTVQRIFNSMDIFGVGSFANECRVKLAEYLVFDAVIGNVDRHHENWGILRKRVNKKWRGRLAPTFDHASSLGREVLDTGEKKSRERYLDELGIGSYAERAHGAIFITEDSARGPSPLELVRWCLKAPHYRHFFKKACRKLAVLDPEVVKEIIEKVPADWMTPLSRTFAFALICYNRDRLKEVSE